MQSVNGDETELDKSIVSKQDSMHFKMEGKL